MPANLSAQGGEVNVTKFEITSNYTNQPVDVAGGFIEMTLYESMLDTTVRVVSNFADTGYGSDDGSAISESIFNKSAGEKTELVLQDSYGQQISFTGDYQLRTRSSARESFGGARNTNTIITTDFYSKESIDNHLLENRVVKKYEGKPSDNVSKILKEVLKTPKNVDVDQCANDFNFLGYNEKPFYKCNWLCKRSAPSGYDGTLAGYLFYETMDNGKGITGGYHFKSIDKLFSQSPMRKMIMNNSHSIPLEYDNKILNHYENTSVDLESQMSSGALFKTNMELINPLDYQYSKNDFDFKKQNLEWNNGGTDFWKLATDLDLQSKVPRYSSKLLDTGVLPAGATWDTQKDKSKEINFDPDKIVRQATNRLNQLFTIQCTIIISCDLGLHVGDLIHCDFPEVSGKRNREVSKNKSGIYMIMDLAHKISSSGSYTSLHLVRDSINRKSF